ncbi:glycine/sarcosine/betaine reductase complex component C subunit alpha [Dongshaea marina]|uniref:glycine/sarcosine/betaine reductase complex component C subunit alpha n=1 Tax=Dongshaea marina TaxID=2047966 RepID=UPI000D3E13ED|nr:glycine/sarcosine/betaine reductase complex component C subunit alpha [Dongshaea marina]
MAHTDIYLAELLEDMAGELQGGGGKVLRIGLTTLDSEHGSSELIEAAVRAATPGLQPVLIGEGADSGLPHYPASNLNEAHRTMEQLLQSGEIHGAVTLHYAFPLGVTTITQIDAPATGRKMVLASTTGSSATERKAAMLRNAVLGTALAKASGVSEPSLGILNVESAPQVERGLSQLAEGGYPLQMAGSSRANGGALMRGNDLLQGSPDVMVADSLTGNLLVKLFSAFNTGGGYEATGVGYGPGLGAGVKHPICIISRASGAPVITNALGFCAQLVRGDLIGHLNRELALAERAGLSELCKSRQVQAQSEESVAEPARKTVNSEIGGIDILEVEIAKLALWKAGIYAETGMGCTGPVLLLNRDDESQARELVKEFTG